MVSSFFAFNINSLLDNHLEEMKKRDISDSPSWCGFVPAIDDPLLKVFLIKRKSCRVKEWHWIPCFCAKLGMQGVVRVCGWEWRYHFKWQSDSQWNCPFCHSYSDSSNAMLCTMKRISVRRCPTYRITGVFLIRIFFLLSDEYSGNPRLQRKGTLAIPVSSFNKNVSSQFCMTIFNQ